MKDRYSASISTDAQILVALLKGGPQTCKVLSMAGGRHFSTVWIALTKLERAGVIEKTKAKRIVYWSYRLDSISSR